MNSFARDAKPPPNSPARPSSSRANMRLEAPAAAGASVGPVEGEVEDDEPEGGHARNGGTSACILGERVGACGYTVHASLRAHVRICV